MRIAIDARLNAYRLGGIPQYTRQLLAALAEIAPEEEFISLQHRDQLRPLAIAPNVARRTALTPPHHRFEQWTLPLELLLARPNVLHSPDFIAPLRRSCPAVVTIHDLAFMHYPEILDDAARAYYSQVTTNAPRADGVIAVSEATRQDIAQFVDIPIEQIDVIYEAAAPLYKPIDLRPGEARVLNSTPVAAKSFLLFVSTLEPRKNLPTLLQALRICLDRRPQAGYRLVVAGRRGWRDEQIFQAVRDLNLGNHVLFAGGVGQYDLRWLYNACRIYINPSLYEGFGLPMLEAMACGAPCLAAATSSLPEIGGDAALYVPPLEADSWADEIEALWDDDERQAEMGRMGLGRAAQFSWLRTARETLKVYKRAAEGVVAQPSPLPQGRGPDPLVPDERLRLAGSSNGARICLRCGSTMAAGTIQNNIRISEPDEDAVHPARVWACPSCGHVELVIDWEAPALDEPRAAVETASVGVERVANRPLDAETKNGVVAESDLVESETEPEATASEAPDEAPIAESESAQTAALQFAELDAAADEPVVEPVELAADSEQGQQASETELAANAHQPELVEPELVVPKAPIDEPNVESEPALLQPENENAPETEVPPETPKPYTNGVVSHDTASAEDDESAGHHGTNGVAAPSRRRRVQQPEPANGVTPKRRQSRAKRK